MRLKNVIFACVVFLCASATNTEGAQVPPTIEIKGLSSSWENVTKYMPERQNAIYHAESGTHQEVSCTANYPIRWSITGAISHKNRIKFKDTERNLDENSFTIKIAIALSKFAKLHNSSFAFKLRCEEDNSEERLLADELFVFIRGNLNSTIVKPFEFVITNSLVLPCLTTEPKIPVQLFKQFENGKIEEITERSLKYSPIIGFQSLIPFNGHYFCQQLDSKVYFDADVTVANVTIKPTENNVRIRREEQLEFTCVPNSLEKVVFESSNKKVVIIKKNFTATVYLDNTIEGGMTAVLKCVSIRNGVTHVHYKWDLVVSNEFTLEFDNYVGELNCFVGASPRRIQTLRCGSSMHCQYLASCLNGSPNCNYINQVSFENKYEDYCKSIATGNVKQCVSIYNYHYSGLVQCDAGEQNDQWEFFTALNLQKYKDWRDAPTDDLVRIDEVPVVLQANSNVEFVCQAVSYLFADSLTFELEYRNGTLRRLRNDDNITVKNIHERHPRKIEDFNVVATLNLKLPADAAAVHCIAPMINSTEIISTVRKLQTVLST